MREAIHVQKLSLDGEVTWQYDGEVVSRSATELILEARFNRPDLPFQGVVFRENDRFVETFYMDRWYNIFEIHDRDDDQIKGWYCNVCRPAMLGDGTVSYVDLSLDLWVSSVGQQTVLDIDEFAELNLDQEERSSALAALAEVQQAMQIKRPPD